MKFLKENKITHEAGWWHYGLRAKLESLGRPHRYKIIDAWSWGPFLVEKR